MLKEQKSSILRVGQERNAHGTRIARRIVCSRCLENDYIYVHSNAQKQILCNKCAQKELNIYEIGTKIAISKIELFCTRCNKKELVDSKLKNKQEYFCKDCLSGFDCWRGTLGNHSNSTKSEQIKHGNNGTILRMRNISKDKT